MKARPWPVYRAADLSAAYLPGSYSSSSARGTLLADGVDAVAGVAEELARFRVHMSVPAKPSVDRGYHAGERRPRTALTGHENNKRCAMSLPNMARRGGVVTAANARSAPRVPARTGVDR